MVQSDADGTLRFIGGVQSAVLSDAGEGVARVVQGPPRLELACQFCDSVEARCAQRAASVLHRVNALAAVLDTRACGRALA